MKDLALDTDTGDLAVSSFDLHLADGLDQIRQKVKIVLRFYYGEWFLDTTKGIKYYDDIFVKNQQQARVESVLRAAILETPGINELLEFTVSFDTTARILSVIFTANTTNGLLTYSETLP